MVAYYMQQPPALDDTMTRNFVQMLKWAPLFFLGNGYWMASNGQIFANSVSPVTRLSDSMKSLHFFKFTANDPALPLMLMFFANLAVIIIMIVAREWMIRGGFALGQVEIAIDEDLPHFFKALTLSQAKQIVKQDNYLKKNFGFEMNDPDTIEVLAKHTMPKKAIQGTPWYHILSNKRYVNEFIYFGPHIAEREKLIEDGDTVRFVDLNSSRDMTDECMTDRLEQSDMVMILFALAYLPDEVVRTVEFTQE
jgi:hypothetical protein